VQNMVALAITSAQGMDITQRVLGEKQSQHQVIVEPQQQK